MQSNPPPDPSSQPQQGSTYTQTQSTTNAPPMMPEMMRGGSSQYSDAHYRFLNTLIESESARTFFKQIVDTDFSHQCVNAFFKVLTSGFDKNAILARNTRQDINRRIIDFKIKLNLMVTECHESDIQNPAFLTFQENILDTFQDFVSRSISERDQLLRQEYGTTVKEEMHKVQQSAGALQSKFSRGP